MLVVVSILGILVLLAMPRIERALSDRDVRSAKVGLANLVVNGKMSAASARRPVTLTVTPDLASLTMVNSSGATQFLSAVNFSRAKVVASPSAAKLTIQPTGMIATGGTPYSVTMTKGGVKDSVVVTGYGRVR